MIEAILEDPVAPVVADAEPQRLDPRIVTAWQISGLVAPLVVAAATSIVVYFVGWPWLWAIPALVLVLGVVWAVLLPPAQWRAWRWRVGEADVRVERGVFWRHVTVVPHARIQHVDTQQGPIARAFGLSSVHLHTAGTVGAVVEIPGLAAATAEALRDRLAALSGAEDAV